MTFLRQTNRVWSCLLVCLGLVCISFIALAQERASDPPKEDTTQENRAVLDFQKPEKIIIQERKAGDPDRPVISGKTSKPEPRAASGYLKVGDIAGESQAEAKQKVPAHTPEWTDHQPADPGRAGGVTHEDNWKENQATADDKHKDWINLDSMSSPRPQDSGMKVKAAEHTPRYECGQEGGECYCDGVLDCNNLFTSGDCKKNTEWQDGNDPSKGGCIEN
ncbi:MAG: hypothetical protein EX271_09265 [Acidimicrobiales bacterium]|nr:MAG: hypothetical protein EX271_09265 [Acidimicrobiales bacterium]